MRYCRIDVLHFSVFICLVDIILYSSSSPPDLECQDHSITFTEEPADMEVGCGSDDVAVFPCRYEGTSVHPQWVINSTVYSSLNSQELQLPPDHFYSHYTLTVTNLSTKNGSVYQCQLVLTDLEEGYPCLYQSRSGHLITKKCKVYAVQYFPYYYYGGSNVDRLTRIHIRIFQVDKSVGSYIITFYNSNTGTLYGTDVIPTSSCTDGICNSIFNISPSSYSTDINVTITDSHENYSITDPIKIDGVNKFVKVSITSESASEFRIISCRFKDQIEILNKSCAVSYGPITPGCEDMPYSTEGSVSASNSVTVGINNLNFTNVCFVVAASNGDKTVQVEGKYYNSDYSVDKHHIQSVILIMFGVLISIILS